MITSSQHLVLLVEDLTSLAALYREYMQREGFGVKVAADGKQALAALAELRPSAIVLDLMLPDMNGLEILRHAKRVMPEVPVIVATVTNSVEVAIDAMKMGAYDYLVKPLTGPRLATTLFNALRIKNLEDELTKLHSITNHVRYLGLVGQSPEMQNVYQVIDSVAHGRTPVLIEGEKGAGKELVGETIHRMGARREKLFVTLNCHAIPYDMMETTLFGDAKTLQIGMLKAAHGATLYIHEICAMPLPIQVKFLQFLKTSSVTPIGGFQSETIDVRIMASSNRNLNEEVRKGRLREDLFQQLCVVPLPVPPLRERGDDVLLLASHFMARYSKEQCRNFTTLSPEVARLFRQHEWTGNVRQLSDVIHAVVSHNNGPIIKADMLPDDLMHPAGVHDHIAEKPTGPRSLAITAEQEATGIAPLWKVEKNTILMTLDHTSHDIPRAAALLEISPAALFQKLQMWRDMDAGPRRKRNTV